MRVCGVVAEYNPFHLGHAYHLARAREVTGCDYVAVVMSGSFVERGEPAVMDKWERAECALLHGADLVVELPARFAVRSADWFARGGVGILSGMGADALCFGCESPVDTLLPLAKILCDEPDELRAAIRQGLDRGETLARARSGALCRLYGAEEGALSLPNNALAMEYMRANLLMGEPMEIYGVPRAGDYHAEELPGEGFASATAIRSAAMRGEDVSAFVPEVTLEKLRDRNRLYDPRRFDDLLIYALRTMEPERLAHLCDGGEGVENRLIRAAREAGSREALLTLAKCKRYTWARLSRLCAQAMLGLTPRADEAPRYARVLGFRRSASPLMRRIREKGTIPLCADPSAIKDDGDLRMDALATDIFGLCTGDEALRASGRDFRRKPVIVP